VIPGIFVIWVVSLHSQPQKSTSTYAGGAHRLPPSTPFKEITMSQPTHFFFTHGYTEDEHAAICDAQTTLVARHILKNGRSNGMSMTVQQATEWLQRHDPEHGEEDKSCPQPPAPAGR